jgi:hypothetical protein
LESIRAKEGALREDGAGSFTFPPLGKRGAFVMEFKRGDIPGTTFSLLVNDQPLFSSIDLHRADFRTF